MGSEPRPVNRFPLSTGKRKKRRAVLPTEHGADRGVVADLHTRHYRQDNGDLRRITVGHTVPDVYQEGARPRVPPPYRTSPLAPALSPEVKAAGGIS